MDIPDVYILCSHTCGLGEEPIMYWCAMAVTGLQLVFSLVAASQQESVDVSEDSEPQEASQVRAFRERTALTIFGTFVLFVISGSFGIACTSKSRENAFFKAMVATTTVLLGLNAVFVILNAVLFEKSFSRNPTFGFVSKLRPQLFGVPDLAFKPGTTCIRVELDCSIAKPIAETSSVFENFAVLRRKACRDHLVWH